MAAASPPFKVKALYAYTSEHADDLNFPEGQVITVTDIEDDDWYIGEYTAADGEPKSGLFPNNFVEKYEPAPPPRPTRGARPKHAEPAPAPASAPIPAVAAVETPVEDAPPAIPAASKPAAEEEDQVEAPSTSNEAPAPAAEPAPAPVIPAAKPAPAPSEPKTQQQPPPAPKPEPAEPVKATPAGPAGKKPPPPVAEKSSSFKDRLAAFNKQGAAPIAPFKPGGSAPSTFIKKPFVAPPPSRHAYVPPVTRNEPPPKVYRREEDPEIAQRKADDEEAAERAGLTATAVSPEATNEGDEDAPKPVSLKERIALLQKQQQEQAARRADTSHKKKPERPPPAKKRPEAGHEGTEPSAAPGASVDQQPEATAERATRDSSDTPRDAPPVRKSSRPPVVPKEREVSDGNEADQSAGGEQSEDAGRDSSTEEEIEPARPHAKAAAPVEPEADEEEDTEGRADEDDEEDDVDEETKRQQALRERMAKLSGGMGMGAMFGPPGGMAMPGMGGAAGQKKKKPATAERRHADDAAEGEEQPLARAPMVPIPGMGLPGMARSMSEESAATLGREDRDLDEEEDRADVASPSPMGAERSAPPPAPADRAAPQSPQSASRGAPPPIPGGRPSTDSRAVPAPPPPAQQMDESEGSEADDEIAERSTTDLPLRGAPPPLPAQAPHAPPRMSMDSPTLPQSPISPTDKRASRLPPPIPVASPTMAPAAPSAGRAPPPPPPTGAPPSRQGTVSGSLHRKALSGIGAPESGSEYEGDYDTDIASGEKHKDALKSHTRDPSLDESLSMDTPVRSPPIPQHPHAPPFSPSRGAPPPLPTTAPRKSVEQARGAPPPVPSRVPGPDDDDYDPFNYSSIPAVAARSPPPAAPAQAHRQPPLPPSAAPAMPAPPPVPARQDDESEDEDDDEDDLYSQPQQPPPRKSMDRPPPPLPPQAPPSHDRAPPPLPPQAAPQHAHFDAPPPAPPQTKAPPRPSMDQDRSFAPPSRTSTEPVGRPSMSGHRPPLEGNDFIARDIDLAETSLWWTQPNTPPPTAQGRSDVGFEIEESTSSKRGGKTIVSKDVYLLYQDYSQTVVTARYDAQQPQDVQLEQRHEAPPGKLRQDQLENWWTRYGASIAKTVAEKSVGSSAVGDGSANALVLELLKNLPGALAPVGTRAYGAPVYANMGNASIQQFDEIRTGDIATFRNAKFQGKHGGLHTKYSLEVAGHVGVVVEWDGTKKKIRVAEQGRERKKDKKGKVEVESYRLEDLRSGEVRVWRVVGREFVGWDGGS